MGSRIARAGLGSGKKICSTKTKLLLDTALELTIIQAKSVVVGPLDFKHCSLKKAVKMFWEL